MSVPGGLQTSEFEQPASHTGTWAALDDAQGRVFWRQGDPLPQRAGIDTDWVYTGV